MRLIMLPFVACPSLPYFSTFLINGTIFKKTLLDRKPAFGCVYYVCLKNFSFWEEFSKMLSQLYTNLNAKYRLFLSDFNENWTVSIYVRQILQFQISWKSSIKRLVVLFRQTDTWRIYWSLFAILQTRLKRNISGLFSYISHFFILIFSLILFSLIERPFEVMDAPVSPSRSLDSNLGPETYYAYWDFSFPPNVC